jgi:hypothetical protein
MIFYLRKIIRQQFLNNVVKIADKKCNSAISAERESAGALNICARRARMLVKNPVGVSIP